MARWARVLATAGVLMISIAGTATAAARGVWTATGDLVPGGDAVLYTLQTAERPTDHLVATVTTSGGLTHAALYRPGAGGFTEIAAPEASSNRANWPIAWGADGKLYLAQYQTAGTTPTRLLWRYTPATDSWQTAGSTPAFPEALVAGPQRILLLNPFKTFAYTPGTGTWAQAARMAHPTLDFAAARSGSAYYVIGGRAPGSTAPVSAVQIYHPPTNTWTAGRPMPHRRRGASAATGPDGRIYVLGGTDSIGRAVPWVDVFTPSTGTWSSFAPAHGSPLGAAFASDGRLHALGAVSAGALTRHDATVEVADDLAPTDTTAPLFSEGPSPVMLAPRGFTDLVALNAVWGVSDPSGVCFVNVQRSLDGGAYVPVPSAQSIGNALGEGTPYAQALPAGHVVGYRVQAVDCAGNRNATWRQGPAFRIAARSQTAATYAGAWTAASGDELTGGGAMRTGTAGASATFTFTGSAVSWIANRTGSSAGGPADVYVDGELFATVDTGPGGIVFTKRWAGTAEHTITIVAGEQSFGTTVWVDGFLVLNQLD